MSGLSVHPASSPNPAITFARQAYLQLAGVAYTVRECSTDAACPTGRLPALEIGSTLVGPGPVACPYAPQEEAAAAGALLGYLLEHVADLDRSLRGAARGEAVAFRSLVQTELLPALVYSTWCEEAAYKQHVQVCACVSVDGQVGGDWGGGGAEQERAGPSWCREGNPTRQGRAG